QLLCHLAHSRPRRRTFGDQRFERHSGNIEILRQRLLLELFNLPRCSGRLGADEEKKKEDAGGPAEFHGPSTSPSRKNTLTGITSSFTAPGRRHCKIIRAAPPLSQNSI